MKKDPPLDKSQDDDLQLSSLLKSLRLIEQSSSSLEQYISSTHSVLKKILFADNFFCWIYDSCKNTYQIVYCKDEFDNQLVSNKSIPLPNPLDSPTAWVVINGKELIFNERNYKLQEVWGSGGIAEHWIGVPLKHFSGQVIGALVIQRYKKNTLYSNSELNKFRLFCHLFSKSLEKFGPDIDFKKIVSDKSKLLERNIKQLKQSKRVQQVVFQISDLVNKSTPLTNLFSKVYELINTIFDARNLTIARYDNERDEITYSYVIDKGDVSEVLGKTIKLKNSMTSNIIKNRKAEIISPSSLKSKLATGEVQDIIGDGVFESWLGVPMISNNTVFGVIIIQSYEKNSFYSNQDLELIIFVASHIASAIDITLKTEQAAKEQSQILIQSNKLVQQNIHLSVALKKLESTQSKLIQNGKMSSLITLVSGVAHELNTPLGICITAVSSLSNTNHILRDNLQSRQLTKNKLERYIQEHSRIGSIVGDNLERTVHLINSYKAMSIKHMEVDFTYVNLSEEISSIINNYPFNEQIKPQIKFECPSNLTVLSNSQTLKEILTHLISNSILHGFKDRSNGEIKIEIIQHFKLFQLVYSDNGIGMRSSDLTQLFDPFFTTKRTYGCKGVGAHNLYNLVTISLKGHVEVFSPMDRGLTYHLNFPKKLKKSNTSTQPTLIIQP